MRYVEYITLVLLIAAGIVLDIFMDLNSVNYEITVVFSIMVIILTSFMIAVSFRAFTLFKTFDNVYFTISYSVILVMMVALVTKQISFNTYNYYHFNFIKSTEIIVLFFGVYLLREKHKIKRTTIDMAAILIFNMAYFFIVITKLHHVNYLLILLYAELIYLYGKIENKNVKKIWQTILIYKLISEIILVIVRYSGIAEKKIGVFEVGNMYIFSYLFFLYSIIKMFLYFNNILNRGYFRQMYLKEKKFNKLLNVMSDGIIIVSGYFIKKVNKSAVNILGYKESAEIVGKNIFSAFEGVKKENIEDVIKSYPNEKNIEFKKYNEREKKIKSIGYSLASGHTEESVLIFKKENFLESGISNFNDNISIISYIFEEGYGYRYVSKSAKEIVGWGQDEFYRNPEILGEIINESSRNSYNEQIKKGEGKTEIKLKTRDGKNIWFILNLTKMEIEDKKIIYGIMTDITELKLREEELENKNRELEDRNIKKEMGMSIVSHEIRTPITAIIGFIENIMINRENVEPDLLKMIHKVYSNSIRLKELVNNFLDFNKLNAGKMEVIKENIEIKGLIDEVCTNNEMLMELKGISYENNLKNGVYIHADSGMMYQVINNLISNAIKYNKENGKIIIEADYTPEKVILKITDTGAGIKSENIDLVFREYERVKGVKEKGTGLGMPISKRLIEINGGKIWLTSEYGTGSTFYISLNLSSF